MEKFVVQQDLLMSSTAVERLANLILQHKKFYYSGTPEISDTEYDQLEEELRKLSPNHPVLDMVGSEPTEKKKASAKVKHKIPMLSLDKTYDSEQLIEWSAGKELLATYKLDGNSLSLIYEEGKLIQAKTRGNGKFGEDVSDKIAWVSDCLPFLELNSVPANFEIRGELCCSQGQFSNISAEMAALELEQPSSPRNIVSGILGRKKHLELARFFNFFAFDLISSNEEIFTSEKDKMNTLQNLGYRVPTFALLTNNSEILNFLSEAKENISKNAFGIDGIVFTYNNTSTHQELGSTAHHPKYKLSFKWQGETAQAKIEDFVWSTSRLGIVTPVAIIDPVFLSDAQIRNITLHNASHVKTNNLKIGDVIEIVRSGEVIPKFLRVIETQEGSYRFPALCPACGGRLEFDEIRLTCTNTANCPAQQLGRILNWIKCVDIEDLSEKRLQALLDCELVSHASDLYKLKKYDFLKIPLTKEKMADKLFLNIQKRKNIPLNSFLNGLGIRGIGQTTWDLIIKQYPTLENVLSLSTTDLLKIKGFAEKMALQVVSGLEECQNDIEKFLAAGVTLENQNRLSSIKFVDKNFVITGTLSAPRNDIVLALKKHGAKVSASVSKNTFVLIINDPNSQSSKAKKARELNIPMWTEQRLWSELGES